MFFPLRRASALGLAICKSVVEWVNGEIGEDSTGRARGALFGQTCPVGG